MGTPTLDEFVETLFVNGMGSVADRLVLTKDTLPPHDLGGWCRDALRDRVEAYVDARLAELEAEVERLRGETNHALHQKGLWSVENAALRTERDRYREALRRLVERLGVVHEDPAYTAVWALSQNHVGPYRGPQYVDELDAARAALEEATS